MSINDHESTNDNQITSPTSKYETIVCESFQKSLWDNLFRFKNETLFTDICIYVDGVEFKCHKVIIKTNIIHNM